jgi:hypothetical protein
MSPLFCAVAKRPSSEAGAPRVRRHFRRLGDHLFHRPHLPVGFGERTAGRGQVVHDEATLVGRRQEAAADRVEEPDRRGRQQHGHADRRDVMAERRVQPSAVGAIEPPLAFLGHAAVAEGPSRQQRHHGDREEQRENDRDRQADRQRTKELAGHAGQQAERREHHHRGQGRTDQRRHQLRHRALRRFRSFVRAAMDVLHHHHGVVDDQADRDREAAHRHLIDRAAEDPHEDEGGDDRQRQRQRGDGGQAHVAQEDDEDDDGEEPADQDRVAHAGDGVADELGEVVDLGDGDAGRESLFQIGQRRVHALLHRQDVGADLLRNADRDGVAPVAVTRRVRSGEPGTTVPRSPTRMVAPPLTCTGAAAMSSAEAQRPRRQHEMLLARLCEPAHRLPAGSGP